MNFRTTYILLGIVVVALVALGGYILLSDDEKATSPAVEGYLMKTLRTANVKVEEFGSVEIERPGQSPDRIAFSRQGKAWQMVSPATARADSAAVDAVVNGILNARVEKGADLAPNLAAHGLDNPPVKVTVTAGKITGSVSLGNVTIGGDKAVIYVTTSDRPDRPQAARRSDFSALFRADAQSGTNAGQLVKGVSDFRPQKMLGDGLVDPVNQVRSMAVRAGEDQLALFRAGDGVWRFRLPADYGEAEPEADPSAAAKEGKPTINSVRQLLNTIVDIRARDPKRLIESPGELAQYGLDPKQQPMQIDFSRDDGLKETAYVSGPVKGADGVEKYYARHELDGVVAEVSPAPVQALQAAMKAKHLLRDRTVLRVNPARVDAIDIETNGQKVELRRVGAGWLVYDAEGKGRPAKVSAVMDLIERLRARQLATSFPPPGEPDAQMGFVKPAADVKLWEGGIVKQEKADPNAKPAVSATPTSRLLFGHKAIGDVVYARRLIGEAKADFFVPLDAFQVATRSRLEYIDASLKPFGADAVLKLSFTVGKDLYELERADDGKPAAQAAWKINSPERLKGRPADPLKIVDLLNQLSVLRDPKVAADKATDDILNRLEVNPASPRMRVTATVKEQGERVFLFGGDAGTKKNTVYLKPGDQDLVFEVGRAAFDLFQKADVQDTVVHRIDKAKVNAVKMIGWQELVGSPMPLELERKDGKWTVKAGGMFELDPAKVDALLNDLTAPRAEAFVVYKDGPKPEHNLEVAKNALSVVMTLDAGDPVTMVISPPNKEGKVFATTTALPGDVFTMADRFAAVRAKPAALKKD